MCVVHGQAGVRLMQMWMWVWMRVRVRVWCIVELGDAACGQSALDSRPWWEKVGVNLLLLLLEESSAPAAAVEARSCCAGAALA